MKFPTVKSCIINHKPFTKHNFFHAESNASFRRITNFLLKPILTYPFCVHRDDGRDALKIYTDPDYFFNLWRDAMQKELRDAREKRRELKRKEVLSNLPV